MNKKDITYIGLMSGTSLDGVDLTHVSFHEENNSIRYFIYHTATYPYSPKWEKELREAINLPGEELIQLHHRYGRYLGELVKRFIKENKISGPIILSSHGHTVHHRPEKGFTFQIGHGSEIANSTGFPVICDYRPQDIAMGGRGAPLVPIGDRLLFGAYQYRINIGGFANISYELNNITKAHDITAVNTVLNFYARRSGLAYDPQGEIAKSGKVRSDLLHALDALSCYKTPFPSLGYEDVRDEVLPLIESFPYNTPDVLRTYTEHSAIKIGTLLKSGNTLVTGGGAKNTFLIERIKDYAKSKIMLPQDRLIDYKEALVFAFLAYLKQHNRINILSSATGAMKDHSSGVIYHP